MCVDSIIVDALKFNTYALNTCNELHFLCFVFFSLALIVCHTDIKNIFTIELQNSKGLLEDFTNL